MKASSVAMSAIMLVIFLVMTGVALTYPDSSRFQPLVIGIPAIALCILQLVLDARSPAPIPTPAAAHMPPATPQPELVLAREIAAWACFLALIVAVVLLGFWIAIPLFLVLYLRREAKAGWPMSLGLGLGASAALYAVFALGLRVALHDGFLLQWLRGAGGI